MIRIRTNQTFIFIIYYKMTDKLEFTLGSRIIYNVDADHIQNIRNADEDVIKLKSTFIELINQFDEIRSKSES